jgi:hypothetical protein
MKRYFIILVILIASLLIIAGCGQRCGNNPIGATGGGNNGSGFLNSDIDSTYVVYTTPAGQTQQPTQTETTK